MVDSSPMDVVVFIMSKEKRANIDSGENLAQNAPNDLVKFGNRVCDRCICKEDGLHLLLNDSIQDLSSGINPTLRCFF